MTIVQALAELPMLGWCALGAAIWVAWMLLVAAWKIESRLSEILRELEGRKQ